MCSVARYEDLSLDLGYWGSDGDSQVKFRDFLTRTLHNIVKNVIYVCVHMLVCLIYIYICM